MRALLANLYDSGLDPTAVPAWELRRYRAINVTLSLICLLGAAYIPIYWRLDLNISVPPEAQARIFDAFQQAESTPPAASVAPGSGSRSRGSSST